MSWYNSRQRSKKIVNHREKCYFFQFSAVERRKSGGTTRDQKFWWNSSRVQNFFCDSVWFLAYFFYFHVSKHQATTILFVKVTRKNSLIIFPMIWHKSDDEKHEIRYPILFFHSNTCWGKSWDLENERGSSVRKQVIEKNVSPTVNMSRIFFKILLFCLNIFIVNKLNNSIRICKKIEASFM